jgi:hypothetical protein
MQVSSSFRKRFGRRLTVVTCRLDDGFIKSHGMKKAFHKGSNSSCRMHLRQHYEIYRAKCEKDDIPINHWAIPREIWRVMEEKKEEARRGRLTQKKEQQILDFKTVTGPREFTRAGALHAVANLIVTDNQVYAQQHQRIELKHTYRLSRWLTTQRFETLLLPCGRSPPPMICPARMT